MSNEKEEAEKALATSSLKWMLEDEGLLDHAVAQLAAAHGPIEDEDLKYDSSPMIVLARWAVYHIDPVSMGKMFFSGREAFWVGEDPEDSGMPLEELHKYETMIRKELASIVAEKKRRLELMASPEESEEEEPDAHQSL